MCIYLATIPPLFPLFFKKSPLSASFFGKILFFLLFHKIMVDGKNCDAVTQRPYGISSLVIYFFVSARVCVGIFNVFCLSIECLANGRWNVPARY
jgi:hypothetical protein